MMIADMIQQPQRKELPDGYHLTSDSSPEFACDPQTGMISFRTVMPVGYRGVFCVEEWRDGEVVGTTYSKYVTVEP